MAKNQDLKDIIDLIKFRKKKKQSEIASDLSVTPTYMSDMINGRVAYTDSFKKRIYEVYSDIFNDKLLDGFGVSEPSSDTSRQTLVPLVPIAAQGGSLSEFADSAKAYDCEKVISPIKDVDMAICVSGDSMAPEYPSGCQILVKKINERAFIDWGRVYVLDTVNGAVIKKVLPSDSPDKVLCVSINPEYPPFEVHLEHINAFYRVMMMMSLK